MKLSKSTLIAKCEQYASENTALAIALNAILNKEETFVVRTGDYTLRVVRPCGSHGGVVLVTFAPKDNRSQAPFTTASYWEAYYRWACDYCGSVQTMESLALRDAAFKCDSWVKAQQSTTRIAA
jgi:hypothetical protein